MSKQFYLKTISNYRKSKDEFVHWSKEELACITLYRALRFREANIMKFDFEITSDFAMNCSLIRLFISSKEGREYFSHNKIYNIKK